VYVFFLGWKQSGTYVNHRPSKEKLNTLNTSRECEVEGLKLPNAVILKKAGFLFIYI